MPLNNKEVLTVLELNKKKYFEMWSTFQHEVSYKFNISLFDKENYLCRSDTAVKISFEKKVIIALVYPKTVVIRLF